MVWYTTECNVTERTIILYKNGLNLSTNNVFAGAAGASRSYTERLQTTILEVFQISGKSRAATFFFWSTPPDLGENPEPRRLYPKIFSALRAAWTRTYTIYSKKVLRAARGWEYRVYSIRQKFSPRCARVTSLQTTRQLDFTDSEIWPSPKLVCRLRSTCSCSLVTSFPGSCTLHPVDSKLNCEIPEFREIFLRILRRVFLKFPKF